MIETIKSRRSVFTAKSTPDDVLRQEGIISEALVRIVMVTERYPRIKGRPNCIRNRSVQFVSKKYTENHRVISPYIGFTHGERYKPLKYQYYSDKGIENSTIYSVF